MKKNDENTEIVGKKERENVESIKKCVHSTKNLKEFERYFLIEILNLSTII